MTRFTAPFLSVLLTAALAPGAGAQATAPSRPPLQSTPKAAEVTAMAKRLTDKSSTVRATAARFFIENNGDFASAAPALLDLLKIPLSDAPESSLDRDGWEARTSAWAVLGRIGRRDGTVRDALLALLPRPQKPFEERYDAAFVSDYGAFEALAQASTDNPELVPTLLAFIQESMTEKLASLQTLRAEDMSSPEAERAEMIAAVKRRKAGKALTPEARKAAEAASLKRLQAARLVSLEAAREHKRGEFQGWQGKKLAALLFAQKDNAQTLATLTQQFDREPPKVRQGALFTLVWQDDWTGALGHIFRAGSTPSTTSALDWMKNVLLKDKDPRIREYAAHGVACTHPPDTGAIAALLPLLEDADTTVRNRSAPEMVRVMQSFANPEAMTFGLKLEPTPTPPQLAAALADSETVIARLRTLPAADRARLTAQGYATLLREAIKARDRLAEKVKRRNKSLTGETSS